MDARLATIATHWTTDVLPLVKSPSDANVAKIGHYLLNRSTSDHPSDYEVAGWMKWLALLEAELPIHDDWSQAGAREALQAARALLQEWHPQATSEA